MRLWLQGLVLIGLPLLFQVLFATFLIVNLKQIDSVISKETTGKRVLAICQEIRHTVDRYTILELAQRFVSPKDTANAKQVAIQELSRQIQILDSLPYIDESSKNIIRNYRQHLLKFAELISSAQTDYSGGDKARVSLARFVNLSEYFEEFIACAGEVVKDDRLISEHFTPIAQAFTPRALEERHRLMSFVMVGIVCNIMLAAGLALFYGKKTLLRFAVLTKNIKLFSEGATKLEELEGNDELTEVGRSFNEMAEARVKAEDLRNTLLAMVSHDLRSPLSSCNITLGLLLQRDSDSMAPSSLRQIRRVDAELQRLVRMADSLLTVGKIEHDKIELNLSAVTLDDLIGPTLNAVRGISDTKDVGIELDLDPERSFVCDGDKVIQILVNLLSNSLKFAPKGSTILIRIRLVGDSTKLRFEILDHGPGVPAELQSKLFQKFSQLEQPAEIQTSGSGLGLYISKLLVSAHGGEIGCSSPLEGGACFWFELPALH